MDTHITLKFTLEKNEQPSGTGLGERIILKLTETLPRGHMYSMIISSRPVPLVSTCLTEASIHVQLPDQIKLDFLWNSRALTYLCAVTVNPLL